MKDLKLNLIVEALDRATQPLRNVSKSMKGLEGATKHLGAAFHKLREIELIAGLALVGGAVAGGKMVLDLTGKVAALGEGFHASALKAGLVGDSGVEAMQRLQYAVKQLGGDAEGTSSVFFRFLARLGAGMAGDKETIRALGDMHISMRDLKRLSNDPLEAFLRLSDGFRQIQNPALRSKDAISLFSRSGGDMLPVLMAGRVQIKGFMDQLDRVHGVMTVDQIKASIAYIRSQHEMGEAIGGLERRLITALMPALTQTMDKITAWIENLKPADIDRFTKSITDVVNELPKLLPQLGKLLDDALKLTKNMIDLSNKVGGVNKVLTILGGLFVAQAFLGFHNMITGWVTALMSLATTAIPATTGAMIGLDGAMDANPIGLIVLAIEAVILAIALLIFGIYELIKHWDDVTRALENGCKKIVKAFDDLEARMPHWLKKALNGGAGVALTVTSPGLAGLVAEIYALSKLKPPPLPAGEPGPAPDRAPNQVNWRLLPDRQKVNAAHSPIRPAAVAGHPTPGVLDELKGLLTGGRPAFNGTITVKADPGTSITGIRSSGSDDIRFQSARGVIPA